MALPPASPTSTCLVTGASSGIGVDIARELVGRGHGVVLVARRKDRLEAVAEELRGAGAVRVEVVPTDLTDPDARNALWQAVGGLGLTVEVLVNNAGFSTVGRASRTDRRRELDMVRTNIEAVVDLTTLALPGMVERGRGAVLNVASTAAFQPIPGQAGYAASKSFVLSYSQAVAEELRGTGVTVTALCPGPTESEFVEATGAAPGVLDGVSKRLFASSSSVARSGVAALETGQGVVIPGVGNRIGAVGGHLLPRRVLVPLLAKLYPAMKG